MAVTTRARLFDVRATPQRRSGLRVAKPGRRQIHGAPEAIDAAERSMFDKSVPRRENEVFAQGFPLGRVNVLWGNGDRGDGHEFIGPRSTDVLDLGVDPAREACRIPDLNLKFEDDVLDV